MTFYQFKLMPKGEQTKTLLTDAIYLAERVDGDYTFKLFQIDKFYIEEQWHTKFNERRTIESFIATDKLKLYAELLPESVTRLSSLIKLAPDSFALKAIIFITSIVITFEGSIENL